MTVNNSYVDTHLGHEMLAVREIKHILSGHNNTVFLSLISKHNLTLDNDFPDFRKVSGSVMSAGHASWCILKGENCLLNLILRNVS